MKSCKHRKVRKTDGKLFCLAKLAKVTEEECNNCEFRKEGVYKEKVKKRRKFNKSYRVGKKVIDT